MSRFNRPVEFDETLFASAQAVDNFGESLDNSLGFDEMSSSSEDSDHNSDSDVAGEVRSIQSRKRSSKSTASNASTPSNATSVPPDCIVINKAKLSALKQQLKESETQVADLQKATKRAESAMEQQRKTTRLASAATNKKHKAEMAKLKRKLDESEAELEEAAELIEQLESQMDGESASTKSSNGPSATRLTAENKTLQSRIAKLESQLESAQSSASDQSVIDQLRSRVSELELSASSSSLASSDSAAPSSASSSSQRNSEQVEDLTNQNSQLSAKLEELGPRLVKLEKERKLFKQELKKRDGEKANLLDKINRLSTQLSETSGAQAAKASEKVQLLESKISDLTTQLQTAQQRASDLELQLDSAQSSSSSAASDLQQRVDQLETQLQSSSEAQTALEQQLVQHQESAKAGAQALQDKLNAATASKQQAVKELRDQVDALNSKLEAAAADSQQKLSEAAASHAAVLEATKKAYADKAEAKSARTKAKLEKKLQEKVQQLVTTYEAEIASLKQSSADSGQSLTAVKKLVAQVCEQNRSEMAAIRASLSEVSNFPSSINDIMKKVRAIPAQFQADLDEARQNYRKEVSQRRKLYNELQELKGNIRVLCRVRPAKPNESVAVSYPNNGFIEVFDASRKAKSKFEFDRVFQPTSTQEQVFSEVAPLITSVLDGYNVCIFAYGQTGTGKTYTMQGPDDNPGVNTRALDLLFKKSAASEFSCTFRVTLLEIYNEQIRDLLGNTQEALKVKKGPKGMFVDGLTEEQVATRDEVMKVLHRGQNNRAVTGTDMNAQSSRSHLVLSVYVTCKNNITGATSEGKIHLIDLAGSERISRSGVKGQALKEAQAINSSLSALGDVIAARANKKSHIPYRNSQLTYLLKDSLDSDSKTLMFVQVSPQDSDANESVCSLRFASRVRKVELGKATKHVSKTPK